MKTLGVKEFLRTLKDQPVFDVRSPSEYAQGHIVGAFNLPLFSDEERKVVGTKYKQESRDTSLQQALQYISKKITNYFTELDAISREKCIGLYCWRGGFRSMGMGYLFEAIDKDVVRLDKGYKAYRNLVLESFQKKYELLILSGMTGSGKTRLLHELQNFGEQIIDLEALANHKGSAFGAIGMPLQPTIPQFENELFSVLAELDPQKRIWVEDESRMIGRVKIPDAFFRQMRSASVIKIEVDKQKRIHDLIEEYALFNDEILQASTQKLAKRLGGKNTKQIIQAISQKDYRKAIDIILTYYDKTYRYGLAKRSPDRIFSLQLKYDDLKQNTYDILQLANLMVDREK